MFLWRMMTNAGSLHGVPRALSLPVVATIALAFLVGGCAEQKALTVGSEPEFNRTVDDSHQPVLMMFYKEGCASCAVLEPGIDTLAQEYQGRAVVAKIMIMNLVFLSPAPAVKEKYDIGLVPVVILFLNGQERQRWTIDYNLDHYRKALNEVLGPAASPPSAVGR